jgi:hypothetical protein
MYKPGNSAEFVLNGGNREWPLALEAGKVLVGVPSMFVNGQKLVEGPDLASGDYMWDSGNMKFMFEDGMFDVNDVVYFGWMHRGVDFVV